MRDTTLDDLIDDYLKDKISDVDRSHLELLMKRDPALASRLKESQETYRFLEYVRYKEIKKRLRDFDGVIPVDVNLNSFKRRWLFAILLIASILGAWICLFDYIKPIHLAERNFQIRYENDLALGKLTREDILYWNDATAYFLSGDFQNAARLFQPLSEYMHSSFSSEAKWNVLMCQLAIEGPTVLWKKEMNNYQSLVTGSFRMKAIKLLRISNSSLYRWLILTPSSHLSALKPRLIFYTYII